MTEQEIRRECLKMAIKYYTETSGVRGFGEIADAHLQQEADNRAHERLAERFTQYILRGMEAIEPASPEAKHSKLVKRLSTEVRVLRSELDNIKKILPPRIIRRYLRWLR